MPPRMVAFDTESKVHYEGEVEVQEWRVGCAIRWRTDTKSSTYTEAAVFDTPMEFWSWVSEYTRTGTRTVVWAHNLGHDVRISQMFEILPALGYHLEWCNLDRNISSATWRSDHGTIVLADTWTWIPLPLEVIAPQVGMIKYEMPRKLADDTEWARYCLRDAEILYNVVRVLISFISSQGLGNWQPTGAGMAYATWRHKFLKHKVLVSDDRNAIEAERIAMHTGRAEAWKHGTIYGTKWTEVDLKNAYVTIASEVELPRKLHDHCGSISIQQFQRLSDRFAVLCRVEICGDLPILPARINGRHIWPVGTFETWAWDPEIRVALRHGAQIKIKEVYVYVRAPILQDWARWVLGILSSETVGVSPIVRTHIKHCGRALIGRIALRTPSWKYWGVNLEGRTGITHMIIPEENRVARMLHVGDDVLIETSREEGKDSLPMVTGYIMSACRARLWEAMMTVGLDNLAHVDTDSILTRSDTLAKLRNAYGDSFDQYWAVKGTYTRLTIWGPRAYYRDKQRVTAGIPLRATETAVGEYSGERWSALATDLADGHAGTVRVTPATWHVRRNDPRRRDAPGAGGDTIAYDAAGLSSANRSSPASANDGE